MKPKYGAVLTLALILTLFSGCGGEENPPEEETENLPEAVTVPAFVVDTGVFLPKIEVSGTLAPELESAVAAEAGGTVTRINVREGDLVREGESLAAFATNNNVASIDVQDRRSSLANAEARAPACNRKRTTGPAAG